ncbi:MAG: lysophospholipid acyltransferase family protein [Patescibacteria group bacterium]
MLAKIFQILIYWPIFLGLRFFTRFEIQGQENLIGLEKKPVIFAVGPHCSYIDGPIFAAAMPRQGFSPRDFFPVRFLCIARYFSWKYILIPIFLFLTGTLKVVRSGGDLEKSLAEPIKVLKNSSAKICIFPEGKLSSDGKLQQGKRGTVYLFQQTGAIIVPAVFVGNFKILSIKTLFRTKKLKVILGKPLFHLTGTLENMTEQIMREIGKLSY